MPGPVTAAIHHMLAMKKNVPATQLQPKAARCDRHPPSTTSHGTSPTQARYHCPAGANAAVSSPAPTSSSSTRPHHRTVTGRGSARGSTPARRNCLACATTAARFIARIVGHRPRVVKAADARPPPSSLDRWALNVERWTFTQPSGFDDRAVG